MFVTLASANETAKSDNLQKVNPASIYAHTLCACACVCVHVYVCAYMCVCQSTVIYTYMRDVCMCLCLHTPTVGMSVMYSVLGPPPDSPHTLHRWRR